MSDMTSSIPTYTIYYDESNNVRKLSINEDDDSYNVDNYKSQTAASKFML